MLLIIMENLRDDEGRNKNHGLPTLVKSTTKTQGGVHTIWWWDSPDTGLGYPRFQLISQDPPGGSPCFYILHTSAPLCSLIFVCAILFLLESSTETWFPQQTQMGLTTSHMKSWHIQHFPNSVTVLKIVRLSERSHMVRSSFLLSCCLHLFTLLLSKACIPCDPTLHA